MDDRKQLGEFLRARRELADPDGFELPDRGQRRVRGLRREEVAMLAGLSTDYYIRLEQGRNRHPSGDVIAALANVFDLDDDAYGHLRQLALPSPRTRRPVLKPERVSPEVLSLLGRWNDMPAFITGRFRDVLACTPPALALHPGLARERNMVRMLFLDPDEAAIYPAWEQVARDSVAWLRAAAGTDLNHPRLTELVGELVIKSPEFARLWARHDVRTKSSGAKRLIHPAVGEILLAYETLTINAAPGQALTVYHAEPGTASATALALLTSHDATTTAHYEPTQVAPGVMLAD